MEPTNQTQYWAPAHVEANMFAQIDGRAHYAFTLIQHFAVVAARPDGQDDSGRQKLALLEPEELVNRAFAIADAYIAECERRGIIRPHTLEACKESGFQVTRIQREIDNERWSEKPELGEARATRKTRMQALELEADQNEQE